MDLIETIVHALEQQDEKPLLLKPVAELIVKSIEQEGFVIVPKRITKEMKKAGDTEMGEFTDYEYYGAAEDIYKAMINAFNNEET